jgi:hypothetical protein
LMGIKLIKWSHESSIETHRKRTVCAAGCIWQKCLPDSVGSAILPPGLFQISLRKPATRRWSVWPGKHHGQHKSKNEKKATTVRRTLQEKKKSSTYNSTQKIRWTWCKRKGAITITAHSYHTGQDTWAFW